jgi:Tfp pilus assembly protein PilF
VRLDPNLVQARAALAVDLAERGEDREAEREFQALLANQPRHAPAHLNYGTLLLKAGRWDEGIAHVKRALELEPAYWKAHLALLAVHVDRGETAEAEQVFRTIQERCQDANVLERARELMGRT